jgi:hypothetical protein
LKPGSVIIAGRAKLTLSNRRTVTPAVRGGVERRFWLRRERASISAEQLEQVTVDDHRRGFAAAMAALVAEFNAYLDDEDADPLGDLVGYRQDGIWLSRDELLQLIEGMRAAILPLLGNEARPIGSAICSVRSCSRSKMRGTAELSHLPGLGTSHRRTY